MGCSSVAEKGANKDLFQQALVLQETKVPNSNLSNSKGLGGGMKYSASEPYGAVEWKFSSEQFQPNHQQKQQLFLWLSQIQNYSDSPLLIRLGPDWLSSYKRGNSIRSMIPRGIVIEQQFDNKLAEHKIIISIKKQEESNGGLNEPST